MRRIELKNMFLARFASGALVVSVVAGTTLSLGGGGASAQTPPPILGSLSFTPVAGSDVVAITAHTSAGCPTTADPVTGDIADSSQVVITGPDEATGTKTFPNAKPYPIVTNTSATFSTMGPFDLPFKFTLKDAAQKAADPLYSGTGTLQAGTYHITEQCINGFTPTEDFGHFTGTLHLITPTSYETTPSPSPVPSPVVTPSPVPSPVVTPSPVPSPVVTPSPVPSPVVTPSPVPSPVVTPTPGPTPPPGTTVMATTTTLFAPIVRIPHLGCIILAATFDKKIPNGNCSLFMAMVAPQGAAGTVQFKDQFKNKTTALGATPLLPGGISVLITQAFAKGAHTLTAVFTPNDPAAYAPSTSVPVRLRLGGA